MLLLLHMCKIIHSTPLLPPLQKGPSPRQERNCKGSSWHWGHLWSAPRGVSPTSNTALPLGGLPGLKTSNLMAFCQTGTAPLCEVPPSLQQGRCALLSGWYQAAHISASLPGHSALLTAMSNTRGEKCCWCSALNSGSEVLCLLVTEIRTAAA